MTKGVVAVAAVVLLLVAALLVLGFTDIDRPGWMGGGGEVIDLDDPAHQTPPEGTPPPTFGG